MTFMSKDNYDYGDIYATLVLGNPRDSITFVDGHSNYHFVPANHDQTKILSEFIARHIPIYRGIEMEIRIVPLQNQIPEQMKLTANRLVKELRKSLRESETAGCSGIFQLFSNVAQEIEGQV